MGGQDPETAKMMEEARKEMEAEREAEAKKKAAEEEAAKKAKEAEGKGPGWSEAESLKNQGNEFYKKKNFEKAIELYSKAIETCPTDIIYHGNLAAVYIEQKEYVKAIEECDKGIEKTKGTQYDFKKLAKLLARKASALGKSGDLDGALDVYNQSLLQNNDYWTKDAMKKIQKQKDETAAKAYLDDEKSDEAKARGNECLKKSDFPGALKEYEEAIKRNPNNIAVYANRSSCYVKTMDVARALEDANKCIKLDPKFIKGHIRKARAHGLAKEHHKAQDAWKVAMEIEPNNAEVQAGFMKTQQTIQSSMHASGGNDQERMAHAMADPEIQMIMQDPSIQQVLRDMQENPAAGQAALKDPHIMAKIQKLIAAGVLKTA